MLDLMKGGPGPNGGFSMDNDIAGHDILRRMKRHVEFARRERGGIHTRTAS